jgi:hypothetical protein
MEESGNWKAIVVAFVFAQIAAKTRPQPFLTCRRIDPLFTQPDNFNKIK